MTTYWQIAAGDEGRDYSEDFIRFGMAFVGGDRQGETIQMVQPGDRIVLRKGISSVLAVGEVVEREGKAKGVDDKPWLRDFDGWDLRAYCFVCWRKLAKPKDVTGLKRGTIDRIHKQHLKDLTEELLQKLPCHNQVSQEPQATHRVEDDDILRFLIKEGLRPGSAEELTSAFRRIRLLAEYYKHNREEWDVLEHETRTFLIVPLLLALGWPEQQIRIELGIDQRQRVDIACFTRPYCRDNSRKPNNEDCVLILESKGFRSGLDYAHGQAKHYAEHTTVRLKYCRPA